MITGLNTKKNTYAFGMPMPGRSYQSSNCYRYGMNGQEKDLEIFEGAFTAEYWEYDSRTGRRWNVDPVPLAPISPYACFLDNPIFNSDPYGDEVKPDKESAIKINEGLQATLGKENGFESKDGPIGFDSEKGVLTYNDKYDKTKFNDKQNDFINKYSSLITSTNDKISVKTVDAKEKIEELCNKSLLDIGDVAVTVPYKVSENGKQVGTIQNVYLSRIPMQNDGNDDFGSPVYRPAPKYYSGLSAIHEITGHAYLKAFSPQLSKLDHNTLVEKFENVIRTIYKYNGAIIKGYAEIHQ